MARSFLPLLLLGVALLGAGLLGTAQAEDPARAKLVDHPIKDAKPGEFLLYKTTDGSWTNHFIERVLDVRDGEVLFMVHKTNEDGSKDAEQLFAGWAKIVDLGPAQHQKVLEDEMEEVEIAGQKLWCRHFLVEERVDPDYPEPRRTKQVWYTNDVPCTGKVQDSQTNREAVSWGTMSPDELKSRQEAWRKQHEGDSK